MTLMTHKEANYRPAENTTKRCGTCSMFRDSNHPRCTLVQRPIRTHMTCDYWSKQTQRRENHALHQ